MTHDPEEVSMEKRAAPWELLGTLFILVLGFPWHYVFGWLGGWWPAALLFPVNESTWEHIKLCVWPALLWALAEYPWLGRQTPSFWAAKGAGLLAMAAVMAAGFYGYMAVLGHSALWANLLDFGVATVAGQLVSYRLLVRPALSPAARRSGAIVLVLLLLAFLALSYFPPRLFLFEDPNLHAFGIIQP
jgi:hypothetical protein